MKIYVIMDSTDSWTGEISLYAAFSTLEAARDYLANVKKVPLDLYDRRGENFTSKEKATGVFDGYWGIDDYLESSTPFEIREVELVDVPT